MNKNFSPFQTLETERLFLRKLSLDDAEEIFFLRSDENINTHIDRPKAKSIDDAYNFINKTNLSIDNNELVDWAISFKDNSKLIGSICLWNLNVEKNKAEVGYELLPEFHGKGIANEALSKIIEFGFDVMQLDKIEAYTHKENFASTRLLEKFGFARDPHEESNIDFTVENPNTIVYSLYKTHYSLRGMK
jgi:ribosomal-protein-alanine N-acetyltransferase